MKLKFRIKVNEVRRKKIVRTEKTKGLYDGW